MRFDTIIIGGGLSGLLCGLRLQQKGKKCAIVSAGQNAMHFFSGGFGLLSRMPDGRFVDSPLEEIDKLPEEHPYRKVGKENIEAYANEIIPYLASLGIKLRGNNAKNEWMISASGLPKRTWLTVDDMDIFPARDCKICEKALIVNIEGFLDFNTAFIAEALEKNGVKCRITSISTDDIKNLRKNPSEMRSSNIAKMMSRPGARKKFIAEVNKLAEDGETIILPAVFGLKNDNDLEDVRNNVKGNISFIGTLPPSVPGVRTQMMLKKAFESAGGVFLMGDKVTDVNIEENKVVSVTTANLGEIKLTADNFVLATGSYFGHGLISDREKVSEPVFGLDMDCSGDRNTWYDPDFFKSQAFLSFGVKTDGKLRGLKDGKVIENLYVAGSVLGGCNPLYEGSGAGVAIMTAMCISDTISSR